MNLDINMTSMYVYIIIAVISVIVGIVIAVASCSYDFVIIRSLLMSAVIFFVLAVFSNLVIMNIVVSNTDETRRTIESNKQLKVGFQPNAVVNASTDTFIVNNKLFGASCTKDTLFVQDSSKEPYIIVDGYIYDYTDYWYLSKTWAEEQKKTTNINYKVKEIHY